MRSRARWRSRSQPAATCGSCPRIEVSDEFRAGELEIFRAKAAAEGKPEKMLDQISEGMWKKSLTDYVLLNQPSIRPEDDGKTLETLRAELSGTIGENIEIKRFARFEVGAE